MTQCTLWHTRQVWPGSGELVHVKLVQILILSSPCPHWVNSGQFYSKQETGSIVWVTNLIFGTFCLFYNFYRIAWRCLSFSLKMLTVWMLFVSLDFRLAQDENTEAFERKKTLTNWWKILFLMASIDCLYLVWGVWCGLVISPGVHLPVQIVFYGHNYGVSRAEITIRIMPLEHK